MTASPGAGFVSLVGAGPGDPELLTLKALRRLQEADVVVYDRLVAEEILTHCRFDATLLDVGKTPGRRSPRQEEIDALLVRLGRSGLRVVRLKGGDPFVFGRGGEEALALAEAGVPFEVVPGVSSALAAPLAAGIPVTHRGISTSVTIAAGRGEGNTLLTNEDIQALARQGGTLVMLMAVERLEGIVEGLLTHGRDPDEPAALVHWGTKRNRQHVVRGTLSTIVAEAHRAGIAPPATLVVGHTVALADRLGRQGSVHPERTLLPGSPPCSCSDRWRHVLLDQCEQRVHVAELADAAFDAQVRQLAAHQR